LKKLIKQDKVFNRNKQKQNKTENKNILLQKLFKMIFF